MVVQNPARAGAPGLLFLWPLGLPASRDKGRKIMIEFKTGPWSLSEGTHGKIILVRNGKTVFELPDARELTPADAINALFEVLDAEWATPRNRRRAGSATSGTL